jgi:hypothetical protein
MAESFARRMMAQRLMTDARATPFSDSAGFGGRSTPDSLIRAVPDAVDASLANEAADLGRVAYGGAAMGSLFLPGAGVTDVFGYAPDPFNQGEYLPSFGENIAQGNYLDAGLQTLGVAGDVLQAGGAIVPPLAAVGTALKAPRAARVAGQAADVVADAAKVDPNQAAGAAMDAAQARYFETGQFEPPTAENPVSVVLPTETEPGIIAFHGSGADFDEFRLEMIGTGEGAQAYGYGLYFTDSEDIAKFYRDSIGRGRSSIVYDGSSVKNAREVDGLTDREMILDSIAGEMSFFDQKPANVIERKIRSLKAQIENPDSATLRLAESDAEAQELVDLIRRSAQRDLEIYESLDPDKFTRGKMYKVGLSPKPDELLDYDKFLGDQTPAIKEKVRQLVKSEMTKEDAVNLGFEGLGKQRAIASMLDDNTKIDTFLGDWAAIRGKDNAGEELLAKYGIPGLKYRASGSRSSGVADEAAERNYVIFDDKAVKILEKYGIAGPVLVTGAVVGASKAGNDNEDGGSILPDAGVL